MDNLKVELCWLLLFRRDVLYYMAILKLRLTGLPVIHSSCNTDHSQESYSTCKLPKVTNIPSVIKKRNNFL